MASMRGSHHEEETTGHVYINYVGMMEPILSNCQQTQKLGKLYV